MTAIKKAKQLGLPDLELVRNAIMIGDADYRTNTHYNRARFIARWGKIGEQIALLLRQSDPAWIFHNDSQHLCYLHKYIDHKSHLF